MTAARVIAGIAATAVTLGIGLLLFAARDQAAQGRLPVVTWVPTR